jgi:branched-chain amino acid transport system substrate-binding protein
VTQAGDYIFRVCFIDPFQGKVMAKFAMNTLKVHKVAVLRDIKSDYSVGLANFFVENFKALGGEILADESYSQGDKDFTAQLTSLKGKNPEAVFVPGYYTEVGLIARQARKLGIKVPLLGGDGWDSSKLWEIGGDALNGCYYSNHYSVDDPSPILRKFVNDYKARYGSTSDSIPDAMAALGYDAAAPIAPSRTASRWPWPRPRVSWASRAASPWTGTATPSSRPPCSRCWWTKRVTAATGSRKRFRPEPSRPVPDSRP